MLSEGIHQLHSYSFKLYTPRQFKISSEVFTMLMEIIVVHSKPVYIGAGMQELVGTPPTSVNCTHKSLSIHNFYSSLLDYFLTLLGTFYHCYKHTHACTLYLLHACKHTVTLFPRCVYTEVLWCLTDTLIIINSNVGFKKI